jgi:hypothetical protein
MPYYTWLQNEGVKFKKIWSLTKYKYRHTLCCSVVNLLQVYPKHKIQDFTQHMKLIPEDKDDAEQESATNFLTGQKLFRTRGGIGQIGHCGWGREVGRGWGSKWAVLRTSFIDSPKPYEPRNHQVILTLNYNPNPNQSRPVRKFGVTNLTIAQAYWLYVLMVLLSIIHL